MQGGGVGVNSLGLPFRSFEVNNRNWGQNTALDLVAQPEGYVLEGSCTGAPGRPDVRRLLVWAEEQSGVIDTSEENTGAGAAQLREPVAAISLSLFAGIKYIIADNLLSRARSCDGRGLELWRKLHTEWVGAANQVTSARAARYLDPTRCTTALQLWEALPKWELQGAQIMAAGFTIQPWLQSRALSKLVLQDLAQIIVGRTDLADYDSKLAWVRAQAELAKGTSRAAHFTSSRPAKHDKDVDMNHVAQPGRSSSRES